MWLDIGMGWPGGGGVTVPGNDHEMIRPWCLGEKVVISQKLDYMTSEIFSDQKLFWPFHHIAQQQCDRAALEGCCHMEIMGYYNLHL